MRVVVGTSTIDKTAVGILRASNNAFLPGNKNGDHPLRG
jgi:hypothetical protein